MDSDYTTSFKLLSNECNSLEEISDNLVNLGEKWSKKLADKDLRGFIVAENYNEIAENLNMAHNNSVEISENFNAIEKELGPVEDQITLLSYQTGLMSSKMEKEAELSGQLELNVTQLEETFKSLSTKVNGFNTTFENFKNLKNRLFNIEETRVNTTDELEDLKLNLTSQQEVASDLISQIQSLDVLRQIMANGNSVETESAENNDNVSETSDSSITPSRLSKALDSSIEQLNDPLPSLNALCKKLSVADFSSDLETISQEFEELNQLLETTRHIANNIKTPINLNLTSVLNLRPNKQLHSSMVTTSSIYLKTKELNAPIALVFNASRPNEYFSLYLKQGRVHLQYRLSSAVIEPTLLISEQVINDNEWRKIEVERVGKLATLRIYSEKNNVSETSKLALDDAVVFNLSPNDAKIILAQFPLADIPAELKKAISEGKQFVGTLDSFKFNGHTLGKV